MLLTIFPSILFAQSDFGVGANLNVNIPAGDFDEFYNTGYGGDAHFLYHLGNQAIFSFSVGYNMWKLNVDAFNNKVAEAGINYRFDLESDFKIIPVLVGIKWLLAQGKKSSLYVSFKGGVYNYTLSLKGTANLILPGGNSVPIEIPEVSESGTETMLALGLGYLFKLSKHWFVDFKGNYNILTNAFAVNKPVNPVDPNAVYGIKGTLQYVTILAGINYRF
ncbi:MAG: outer membrane beta-barrel protein [Ignavibacteriaceae bacterium]|nr:outer membrane beta-barrel protein [Ignavibacteria bacterium]NNJ53821.1 outer membrane beta-barrel protein [Ignavibacteriaceae bacterium]